MSKQDELHLLNDCEIFFLFYLLNFSCSISIERHGKRQTARSTRPRLRLPN